MMWYVLMLRLWSTASGSGSTVRTGCGGGGGGTVTRDCRVFSHVTVMIRM
jgi:hypothetical protein